MIITEDFDQIEEGVSALIDALLQSKTFCTYIDARKVMASDQTVQMMRQSFTEAKAAYEEVADYERFLPEVKEKRQKMRSTKRQLDLMPAVAAFRVAESDLQGTLDEVAKSLAGEVSDTIKVAHGNPFFTAGHSSCGGQCHG